MAAVVAKSPSLFSSSWTSQGHVFLHKSLLFVSWLFLPAPHLGGLFPASTHLCCWGWALHIPLLLLPIDTSCGCSPAHDLKYHWFTMKAKFLPTAPSHPLSSLCLYLAASSAVYLMRIHIHLLGQICPCVFQLLVAAGNPWCSLARRCILRPLSVVTWPPPHVSPCPCVSVQIFSSLSYKDTSHRIRVHPSSLRPRLTLITAAETLFPHKAMFAVLEARASASLFGGHSATQRALHASHKAEL